QVEVRAFEGERATRFYTMAHWSAEAGPGRTSVRQEHDAAARMDTDTLQCRRRMDGAQVRITLHGAAEGTPQLKLLTLAFLDSTLAPAPRPANRSAWGRTLEVPERSQLGHAGASGWCSPTSLS